jgi:hypothetical protein
VLLRYTSAGATREDTSPFFYVFLSRGSEYANAILSQQGEEWRSVRCMCGALSGRCQDHVTESGEATTVYRLVKYAIRPVSPSAEYVSYVARPSGSWLIGAYHLGRAGSRSLHSLSKIWQNSHALMRRIGLSFWMRRKSFRGSLYVLPVRSPCEYQIYSSLPPQKCSTIDVALQTKNASVVQG